MKSDNKICLLLSVAVLRNVLRPKRGDAQAGKREFRRNNFFRRFIIHIHVAERKSSLSLA